MSEVDPLKFVSRAGTKLWFALDSFQIDPAGWVCADLGSHVGGFVDCLLQRGADKIYSVDTSYGTLDWRLRNDPRVIVMERTNALHLTLAEQVHLVTVDVGWTPQHLVLPRAVRLLDQEGFIVTLIKPHYEADKSLLHKGVLPDDMVQETVATVVSRLADLSISVDATVESPIRGDAGNREVLALIRGR